MTMAMNLRRLARMAKLTPAEREAKRLAALRFLEVNLPPPSTITVREVEDRATMDEWMPGNGLPWPTAEECRALFAMPREECAYLSHRLIFGVSLFERWRERTGYVPR